MSTRTLLTALFATALTMPAFAQSETAAPAAPPAEATPPAAEAAAPAATVQGADSTESSVSRDKDTLSVDFPDEEIKTILRNVADLFELNLVVPDTLVGKTSIKLRDVTWEQIFTVVLAPVGYSHIKEGNIIKIVSNELLQLEPGTTEVFILNNAKAVDIKPTIEGLVDAASGGKIVIDARSNALIITERPSRMGRIHSIIEQLDKATDQVLIESKFVEVTDRDIRNIGVNWASLQGFEISAGSLNQAYTRDRSEGTNNLSSNQSDSFSDNINTRANTTNSGTNAGGVTSVSTINTPFTVPPALPGIPTGSTVVTTTAPTTTGSTTSSISDTLANTASSAVQSLFGLTNADTTSRLTTAVFSASDFNVILSALNTQSNTKVMSNPTVVTLNNTEAVLNIGQEFPIPSYNYNSERGTFEVSGFTYKPIGIILKVTPQVNGAGIIKLNLEPEVSQTADSTSFGGAGGAQIPIISTRKVKTQVSLKDGYTMGIGGLITDIKSDGGTKVPLLGDIPFLGRLFSSKSVNNTATNLLIFITAKTVAADGGSPEDVFDPRAVAATGMTRDQLPGYRAPKGTDIYAVPAAPAKK